MSIVTFWFIHEPCRTRFNRINRVKYDKRVPTWRERLHRQLNQFFLVLFKPGLVLVHELILLRYTEVAARVFVDD